jgi:hypothetical protein
VRPAKEKALALGERHRGGARVASCRDEVEGRLLEDPEDEPELEDLGRIGGPKEGLCRERPDLGGVRRG